MCDDDEDFFRKLPNRVSVPRMLEAIVEEAELAELEAGGLESFKDFLPIFKP